MNWDAASAIAEAVGALAVLVTLVFLLAQQRQLAKQIEQNSNAIKFASYGERAALLSGWLHQTALDEDLSRIVQVAGRAHAFEDESLDSLGWMRLALALRAIFIMHEDLFFQAQAGTIDPSYWEHRRSWLNLLVSQNAAYRGWWEKERESGAYVAEFIAAIDATRPTIAGEYLHPRTSSA